MQDEDGIYRGNDGVGKPALLENLERGGNASFVETANPLSQDMAAASAHLLRTLAEAREQLRKLFRT
jgi:predicted ATPase